MERIFILHVCPYNLYVNELTFKNENGEIEKSGRILVRPSGTEPLIRVMIEGKDKDEIEREAAKLAELIEKICCD